MRRLFIVLMFAGTAFAAPALAQEADPAPAFDLSASATVTSDYRFRGISQSNKRPAVQAGATVTHESGFYVGTWGSTISNYVASGSDVEVDIFGGYKVTTEGGTTIDGGVTYYIYPDTPGVTTNFFEPYFNISQTFSGLTAKVGTNFAWKQKALSVGGPDKGGFYLYGDLSGAVGPLTVTGRVGRSFTKNYITFGTRYTDWSLTAAYTAGPATFSIGYVDTNKAFYSYPAGGGKNRNVGKAGVVASIGFAF